MSVSVIQSERLRFLSRKETPFSRFWKRFSRHKLSVIALGVLVVLVLCAALSSWISPYNPTQSDFLHVYEPPSWSHWFGTDSLGRDMFSRVLGGLRSAFAVGFGAEVVELTVGILVGAIAGYVGGPVDNILMRIVDIVYAFPSFFFSILLVVLLGHNLGAILLAVSATSWVGMARIVRSQVIRIRESGFVEASIGMGASWWRIIIRYILPNSMGPVLVAITFGIPANMMAEAGLSLIGLGIEPPTPDLGELINEGQSSLFSYPYLLFCPVAVFAVTLLCFALVGDGLRDAFDSKSSRRGR